MFPSYLSNGFTIDHVLPSCLGVGDVFCLS